MTTQGFSSRRNSLSGNLSSHTNQLSDGGNGELSRRSSFPPRSTGVTCERTVKRLRLSKALTIPEGTTVYEASRRMAARRVDAVLLTDSNALLCGILTAKDITSRVVACELKVEETPVSKVMTRNPTFVLSDMLAVEALQKMVQGRFRHLPVVENGEVIALLDITKCLYDAIARMERASEKGKAIAAAVEGVEKHWGTSLSGTNTFIENLRERVFKPSLSTIITDNSKFVAVSPSDTVLSAAKMMVEKKSTSAVVTVDNKPRGILTSKDILMRVVAQGLPTDSTLVEKVMTPNPECATVTTPIIDALHTMHDGKFQHLPVVDSDGNIVSVVNVLNVSQAAVATVGSTAGVKNEMTTTIAQKFWDAAMNMPLEDDDDAHSEGSMKVASDGMSTMKTVTYPFPGVGNVFSFKLEDKRGRMHRFNCDTQSLTELMTAILQRLGEDIDPKNLPAIMYEDDDHDRIVLASDNDLVAAVDHARMAGLKGLKLYLDHKGSSAHNKTSGFSGGFEFAQKDAWASAFRAVTTGAAFVAGMGMMAYLRRSSS